MYVFVVNAKTWDRMKNVIIEAGLGLKSPLLSHLNSQLQTGVSVKNKKIQHVLELARILSCDYTSLFLFDN